MTAHQTRSQKALDDALSWARHSDLPLVDLVEASDMLKALGNAREATFHDLKQTSSALPATSDTADDRAPTAVEQGQNGIGSQQEADVNDARGAELNADEVGPQGAQQSALLQQSALVQQHLHDEEDGGAKLSDAHQQQLTTKEWALQRLLQASQVQRTNGAAGDHRCIRSDEEQGQAGAVIAILQLLQQQVRNPVMFIAISMCECFALKPCTRLKLTSMMCFHASRTSLFPVCIRQSCHY